MACVPYSNFQKLDLLVGDVFSTHPTVAVDYDCLECTIAAKHEASFVMISYYNAVFLFLIFIIIIFGPECSLIWSPPPGAYWAK